VALCGGASFVRICLGGRILRRRAGASAPTGDPHGGRPDRAQACALHRFAPMRGHSSVDSLQIHLHAGRARPGGRLGPYRLCFEIGSGGMATVFLADNV
jgi:hypothetical protein